MSNASELDNTTPNPTSTNQSDDTKRLENYKAASPSIVPIATGTVTGTELPHSTTEWISVSPPLVIGSSQNKGILLTTNQQYSHANKWASPAWSLGCYLFHHHHQNQYTTAVWNALPSYKQECKYLETTARISKILEEIGLDDKWSIENELSSIKWYVTGDKLDDLKMKMTSTLTAENAMKWAKDINDFQDVPVAVMDNGRIITIGIIYARLLHYDVNIWRLLKGNKDLRLICKIPYVKLLEETKDTPDDFGKQLDCINIVCDGEYNLFGNLLPMSEPRWIGSSISQYTISSNMAGMTTTSQNEHDTLISSTPHVEATTSLPILTTVPRSQLMLSPTPNSSSPIPNDIDDANEMGGNGTTGSRMTLSDQSLPSVANPMPHGTLQPSVSATSAATSATTTAAASVAATGARPSPMAEKKGEIKLSTERSEYPPLDGISVRSFPDKAKAKYGPPLFSNWKTTSDSHSILWYNGYNITIDIGSQFAKNEENLVGDTITVLAMMASHLGIRVKRSIYYAQDKVMLTDGNYTTVRKVCFDTIKKVVSSYPIAKGRLDIKQFSTVWSTTKDQLQLMMSKEYLKAPKTKVNSKVESKGTGLGNESTLDLDEPGKGKVTSKRVREKRAKDAEAAAKAEKDAQVAKVKAAAAKKAKVAAKTAAAIIIDDDDAVDDENSSNSNLPLLKPKVRKAITKEEHTNNHVSSAVPASSSLEKVMLSFMKQQEQHNADVQKQMNMLQTSFAPIKAQWSSPSPITSSSRSSTSRRLPAPQQVALKVASLKRKPIGEDDDDNDEYDNGSHDHGDEDEEAGHGDQRVVQRVELKGVKPKKLKAGTDEFDNAGSSLLSLSRPSSMSSVLVSSSRSGAKMKSLLIERNNVMMVKEELKYQKMLSDQIEDLDQSD